jgi:D-alanyl-D-alanine carboxypeptidase (penicillin-binding protein 5/6)
MKRRACRAVSVIALVIAALLPPPGQALAARRQAPNPAPALSQVRVLEGRPAPFVLDAKAAMLVPADYSAPLYAYNEHERMQPASLAKLMTFYITLKMLKQRRITLETPVTVSEAAWRLSVSRSISKMFLEVGQRVTIRDLLFGLMVSSGNDAAFAIAEYIGGSAQAFVAMMNDECRTLGLTETHFENPDGLPAPDQYTTAADMAKLGSLILSRFPEALTYTATKEFTFHAITQRNWNTLLFYDSRVDGLKTGHVEEAGYHLVASAHANNMGLIAVVMGAPNAERRRLETEKLLDWGFRTFAPASPDWHRVAPSQIAVYEGTANTVDIAPASAPVAIVFKEEVKEVKLSAVLDASYLVAPVKQRTKVGMLTLSRGDTVINQIPLITQAAVAKGGFFTTMVGRLKLLVVVLLGGVSALIGRLLHSIVSVV